MNRLSHLYFFVHRNGGSFKIGKSDSPWKRLQQLPEDIDLSQSLIFTVEKDRVFSIESAYHKLFSTFNTAMRKGDGSTEWFSIDQFDRAVNFAIDHADLLGIKNRETLPEHLSRTFGQELLVLDNKLAQSDGFTPTIKHCDGCFFLENRDQARRRILRSVKHSIITDVLEPLTTIDVRGLPVGISTYLQDKPFVKESWGIRTAWRGETLVQDINHDNLFYYPGTKDNPPRKTYEDESFAKDTLPKIAEHIANNSVIDSRLLTWLIKSAEDISQLEILGVESAQAFNSRLADIEFQSFKVDCTWMTLNMHSMLESYTLREIKDIFSNRLFYQLAVDSGFTSKFWRELQVLGDILFHGKESGIGDIYFSLRTLAESQDQDQPRLTLDWESFCYLGLAPAEENGMIRLIRTLDRAQSRMINFIDKNRSATILELQTALEKVAASTDLGPPDEVERDLAAPLHDAPA